METLLAIGYTAFFSFIIMKWKWFMDEKINAIYFISLFAVKVLIGILASELYLYKYDGGDSYHFFLFSKTITQSFVKSPIDFITMVTGVGNDEAFMKVHGKILGWNNNDIVYNDNRTILRLNGLIGLFSMGYYYVHIVFFSFLSMLGLTGIYKAARLLTDRNPIYF
ncbi:MAG: hypothetical protein IPP71_21255 [Bacteroidetes bacterium]|nr:hypothetical protein [Bacteroidota bacterium]